MTDKLLMVGFTRGCKASVSCSLRSYCEMDWCSDQVLREFVCSGAVGFSRPHGNLWGLKGVAVGLGGGKLQHSVAKPE